MRGLSTTFLKDLKTGILQPLLHYVQSDHTLCLCIRDNYINLYYRGGNLFRLSAVPKDQSYKGHFDTKYFKSAPKWLTSTLPSAQISTTANIIEWIHCFPSLKQAIDFYQGTEKNQEEREFQQLILRDNNFSPVTARSSDYFICDIEYSNPCGRFDMIAVHWPSTSAIRKKRNNRRLVLIEVKCGDHSLTGTAGLHCHINDMNKFLANPDAISNLKKEMCTLFEQQHQLGLLKYTHPLAGFSEEKPLYLLLLANHDPDSTILQRELSSLPTLNGADIAVMQASYLGYGLFDEGKLTIADILST
jgi:hypothetical protein